MIFPVGRKMRKKKKKKLMSEQLCLKFAAVVEAVVVLEVSRTRFY